MAYVFRQASLLQGFGVSGSPKTFNVTGCVLGDLLVVITDERSTATVSSVTANGVALSNVFTASGTDHAQISNQFWWVGPVPASGTVTVVVTYSGTNGLGVMFWEGGGLALVSPLLTTGQQVNNNATSQTYTLSPTAPCAIVNFFARISGGANLSGLSGTDRTGVTNVQQEFSDQVGTSGSNSITLTSSAAAFGMSSIALKLGGNPQRTLTGVGT